MSLTLEDIADKRELDIFDTHGPLATGLPAFAYAKDAFFSLEQEKLFPNNWVCVGYSHDLPNTGDVLPIDLCGRPIVLVRNNFGSISAFQNVCRHRCMKLVDKKTNVGRLFKCPYHAWAYDLDGNLRAAPHFGGINNQKPNSFDFSNYGLVPINIDTWGQWIFINLNGNAGNLKEHVKPLENRLKGINLNDLRLVGVLDFGEINTNWKFLMENFIEPYHVPVVHKSTTDQPLGDHYVVSDGKCLGSAVDISSDKDDDELGDSLNVSSRYLTLFPNFVLGRYFPDQLGVYVNLPVSSSRTHQYRAIYKTDGVDAGGQETETLMKLWWDVHKEDHEMCERLQQGRSSAISSEGGILSPHWETSVREFQDLVMSAIR